MSLLIALTESTAGSLFNEASGALGTTGVAATVITFSRAVSGSIEPTCAAIATDESAGRDEDGDGDGNSSLDQSLQLICGDGEGFFDDLPDAPSEPSDEVFLRLAMRAILGRTRVASQSLIRTVRAASP